MENEPSIVPHNEYFWEQLDIVHEQLLYRFLCPLVSAFA